MLKSSIAAALLLLIACSASSQQSTISGRIADSSEKKNLLLSSVSLLRKTDSTLVTYTRSDANGRFRLPKIDTGKYVILVSYPRYADYMEQLVVTGDLDIGDINLIQKAKLLDEVVIRTGTAIRIKGDTTEYVADSFKVKEGATDEDLLKK